MDCPPEDAAPPAAASRSASGWLDGDLSPRAFVAQGGMFDRVLCQVVSVGNNSDIDKNERAKVRHACGYARVQVISSSIRVSLSIVARVEIII